MTAKGSIKETGEEISGDEWRRFEAAVGVGQDKRRDTAATTTEQPYREEAEHPEAAGGDRLRPDDKDDPQRQRDASRTTQRTE